MTTRIAILGAILYLAFCAHVGLTIITALKG